MTQLCETFLHKKSIVHWQQFEFVLELKKEKFVWLSESPKFTSNIKTSICTFAYSIGLWAKVNWNWFVYTSLACAVITYFVQGITTQSKKY